MRGRYALLCSFTERECSLRIILIDGLLAGLFDLLKFWEVMPIITTELGFFRRATRNLTQGGS